MPDYLSLIYLSIIFATHFIYHNSLHDDFIKSLYEIISIFKLNFLNFVIPGEYMKK